MSAGLLVYQFGNSDLGVNAPEPFQRGQDFRAVTRVLATVARARAALVSPLWHAPNPLPSGLDLSQVPASERTVPWKGLPESGGAQGTVAVASVHFPILPSVIQWVTDRHPDVHEWDLLPILTDQDPPHPQDTAHLATLLRDYASHVGRVLHGRAVPVSIAVAEPIVIRDDPSDYRGMLDRYAALLRDLVPRIGAARVCYVQITTGTPAMTFAAGVAFSQTPEVTLLYKPMQADTPHPVAVFREQTRRTTLHRLRGMLERLDFYGAADVLSAPSSGFSKAEVEPSILVLEGLDAWVEHDFTRAAVVLGQAARAAPWAGAAADDLAAICLMLSTSAGPPSPWSPRWRAKITDALLRAHLALSRRDYAALIYATYNFNEVSLIWALTGVLGEVDCSNPGLDPARVAPDFWQHLQAGVGPAVLSGSLQPEHEKFKMVWWANRLALDGGSLARWLPAHAPFRWFLDMRMDGVRNQLVHSAVELQARFFDEAVRSVLSTLRDGDGAPALVGAMGHVFDAAGFGPPPLWHLDLVSGVWQAVGGGDDGLTPPWSPESHRDRLMALGRQLHGAQRAALRSEVERYARRVAQVNQDAREWITRSVESSALAPGQKAQVLRRMGELPDAPEPEGCVYGWYAPNWNREVRWELLRQLDPLLDWDADWVRAGGGEDFRNQVKSAVGQIIAGAFTFDRAWTDLNRLRDGQGKGPVPGGNADPPARVGTPARRHKSHGSSR